MAEVEGSGQCDVIEIVVVYCPSPRQVFEQTLRLARGAKLSDALRVAWLDQRFSAAKNEAAVGIWGRKVALDQVLQSGDRLELYRPLRVDPKVARRERFQHQGARSAGLFAKRRPGAKPGY